ncbi:ISKra4 family transposase (plasmid) [Sinorhizobium medicae]|uniref:ISKra4 family transposase n=1 Tax=Sinorhizobium medicae TaxID=110321 RepID=UPI002AF6B902|nr:ISKra4 family transposase [Sinorhizobium medicae]WQO55234.1 ISKra4 family transposase [Sinorhizobium medicae]
MLTFNCQATLVGVDGLPQRRQIAVVERIVDGACLDDLGLSLGEGKAIQRRLQEELVQFQTDQAGQQDRKCHDCNRLRGVHDYRSRTVHSLFGLCRVRVPRMRICACGKTARSGTGSIETLLSGRATPELERIQAELGSRLSFREAARVLGLFVSAARPHNHRTVSNRLAKVADQIEKWDVASPYRISRASESAVSVFIDGAYIRAVPGYQSRHFEIATGRVVSQGRPPRQFAAAPSVTTGKHDVVRAAMRAQGWLPGRDVTVFSDGEIGLQSIVLSATRQPVTHILDWFHLSMRLRHIEQAWEGIKHVHDLNIYLWDVAVHVPRLRHLLWSGYVREATRAVKHMLSQLDQHAWLRHTNNKLKRLYELVRNLRTYLVQNKASIVDYCRRYWSGQPISSSPAESAANSLVNARMNKKRQMRWSPIGAHRVLQVRAAVGDGRLKQAKLALAA